MKDFMLLFIGADYSDLGLSPEEIQQRMGKWFAWDEKMTAAGVTIKGGEALHAPVRRVAGPERIVTDLASSEVKELVGGYYIVRAADLEGATAIAQDFPDYDLGSMVEIREIVVFDQ
ncbi:MAG: YciI family protein [Bacteroidota bacterium]